MTEKLESCRKQLINFSEKVSNETVSDQSTILSLAAHNDEMRIHIKSVFDSFKEMSWQSVAAGSSLQYENPDNYLGRLPADSRQFGVPISEYLHVENQRVHGGFEEPPRCPRD
jgi:hypothetical protein